MCDGLFERRLEVAEIQIEHGDRLVLVLNLSRILNFADTLDLELGTQGTNA